MKMQQARSQDWLYPASIADALRVQKQMADRVIRDDCLQHVRHIAGMDVSNFLYDPQNNIYATAIRLSYPELHVVESSSVCQRQDFPYIPGLLGFREAPALITAYDALLHKPDLLFIDGHGISHPRGLGIASHIGVYLDIPTIGVAKSILVGSPAQELGDEPGSQTELLYKGQIIGLLIRTKRRANPLIISIGHKISLKTAVEYVLRTLRGYRLPEATRQAHLAANAYRKSSVSAGQPIST